MFALQSRKEGLDTRRPSACGQVLAIALLGGVEEIHEQFIHHFQRFRIVGSALPTADNEEMRRLHARTKEWIIYQVSGLCEASIGFNRLDKQPDVLALGSAVRRRQGIRVFGQILLELIVSNDSSINGREEIPIPIVNCSVSDLIVGLEARRRKKGIIFVRIINRSKNNNKNTFSPPKTP